MLKVGRFPVLFGLSLCKSCFCVCCVTFLKASSIVLLSYPRVIRMILSFSSWFFSVVSFVIVCL